jgi:hypothetical protein
VTAAGALHQCFVGRGCRMSVDPTTAFQRLPHILGAARRHKAMSMTATCIVTMRHHGLGTRPPWVVPAVPLVASPLLFHRGSSWGSDRAQASKRSVESRSQKSLELWDQVTSGSCVGCGGARLAGAGCDSSDGIPGSTVDGSHSELPKQVR